jgi:hypothetical protein
MCRLEQGAVPTTGDDEVCRFVPQVAESTIKVALGRQVFHPFLLHPLAVQHRLERFGGLLGVSFDRLMTMTTLLIFIRIDGCLFNRRRCFQANR